MSTARTVIAICAGLLVTMILDRAGAGFSSGIIGGGVTICLLDA